MNRFVDSTGAAPSLPARGAWDGYESPPAVFSAAKRIARREWERLVRWRRYRRTVRALARLDARTLKDIGLPGDHSSIHAAAWEAANDNWPWRAA